MLDNYRIFFSLIIDYALFLEFSDDTILNPDVAVQQLEGISYQLQLLDIETKQLFIGYISEWLQENKYKLHKDQIEFLNHFAIHFGLEDVT